VPHFLTALVVTNGANAGNLSPVSAVGVIANTKMAEAGLVGHEGVVFFANFGASVLVAAGAYVCLGGYRLSGILKDAAAADDVSMSAAQRLTLLVLAAWVAGVLVFTLNPGLSAFAAAVLLVTSRAARDREAIPRVPWGVIVMVCGVSVLVALLESTGGMKLFEALLARFATSETVNGAMAFVTGAISLYSSTSGVVLPAFLPTVPGVLERLGGGDPLALALSINVGSALVDVSPLSTLGALCVAAVPDAGEAAALFRRLMMWGVSMTLVGAALCQLFAGALADAAR
jgi:di/tricarboxylate transporter